MSTGVEFKPVFLATRRGQEPARLVLAGECLLAILVPISPEDSEGEAEGWYLEVGFGPCDAQGVLFASLPSARKWISERLNQSCSTTEGGESAEVHTALRRPLRILIVEDDILQAEALESEVRSLGHEVVAVAADEKGAVSDADQYRPDLVLMDVRLAHGTSGIDAAAQIQKRFGIRSIIITGYADIQTRVRAEQGGSVEMLSKPVSPGAIAAVLARAAQQL